MNNDQYQESNVAGVAGDGVSFRVSDHDRTLIRSIVTRAFRDASLKACLDFIDESEADARQALTMDLSACHANGCPVNLARLLDADDANFGHDVLGIQRHIDRRTGKLRRKFAPRTMMTDGERALRDQERGQREEEMKRLIAAAHQGGRAEFALEVAKRHAAAKARRAKAAARRRNAKRRKGSAPLAGSKSSHSPRAARRRR
jgi:hypothetical protein